jgi:hypothetical protein
MRAVFVLSDVLRGADDPAAALRAIAAADLKPLVIDLAEPGRAAVDAGGAALLSVSGGRPGCWGDGEGLLARAAAQCDVSPVDAFLLCRDIVDVEAGADAGCRPILVLGDRTLDEVIGPAEARHKEAPVAPDLDTALRYVLEEAGQEAAVGPFPFAERVAVEGIAPAVVPSKRDLAALFLLVILAGVAVALGIAYLLQEVYQRAAFPAIAYWLTLQFIPQTWRGVLFLAIGAATGLLMRPLLARLTGTYRARRL